MSARQPALHGDAGEQPVVERQGLVDHVVQGAGGEVGGGQPRELRELVHQVLERVHLVHDGGGALGEDLLEVGRALEVGLADALGGELDRASAGS